jgi:hypothetical protein
MKIKIKNKHYYRLESIYMIICFIVKNSKFKMKNLLFFQSISLIYIETIAIDAFIL